MQYKTYKRYGVVQAELHADLQSPVSEYVTEGRRRLLPARSVDHDYLFMNGEGTPYSPSLWTARLQDIFAQHNDGVRISANLLRDSFVTYAYTCGISADLKASVARFMGHTVHGDCAARVQPGDGGRAATTRH